MPDEILHPPRVLDRHHPAPSALENDPVHLHVAFFASGAQHREFVRLHDEFDDLASARSLIQAGAALAAGKLLAQVAGIAHLPRLSDGIRGPIISGWVSMGVENFRLKVSKERLDFRAGVRAAERGEVARQILGEINRAGARCAGRALEKGVVGIGEKLRLVRPQKNRADGPLRVLAGDEGRNATLDGPLPDVFEKHLGKLPKLVVLLHRQPYKLPEWLSDGAEIARLFSLSLEANTREIYAYFREKEDDYDEADRRALMWVRALNFMVSNKEALQKLRAVDLGENGSFNAHPQLITLLHWWTVIQGRHDVVPDLDMANFEKLWKPPESGSLPE